MLLSVLAIGHWFYLGGRRFLYPYEILWMEGSMLDQILRILQGKSLYQAPSVEYVPWLYQPFYYYLTALIAKAAGLTFPIARIISVLSTLATGSIIAFIVHKETNKSKFWTLIGTGLFFMAYGKVGYCFEVARVDSLYTALLVLGSSLIIYSKNSGMVVTSAVILSLSYFTKQSAIIFVPCLAFLLFFRNKKNAVIFTVTISLFVLGGIALLNLFTDNWYSYYTLGLPAMKRTTFRWDFGVLEFVEYVVLRCWLITAGAFIIAIGSRFRYNRKQFLVSHDAMFFSLFATALLTAFLGLGNEGGGKNVLLPVAAFAAIILPLIVSHDIGSSRTNKRAEIWMGVITLQFFALVYSPYNHPRNIPAKSDEIRQELFLDSLRMIPGDVWVPYHGFMPRSVGKETFAELRAFRDVVLMNDRVAHGLKHDLDSVLLGHKFAYIFDDVQDTFPGYHLGYRTLNPHKAQALADTMIYVYLPK